MKSRTLCTVALPALLALLYPRSHLVASDTSACGSGFGKLHMNHKTFSVLESDFPEGDPFRTALIGAINGWSNTRSKVDLDVAWNDDPGASPEAGNEISEIFLVDNLYPSAVTMTWKGPPTCTIQEADVLIYSGESWTASTDQDDIYAYGGSGRPFQPMLYHELGHAQGIGHTHDVYSVMGQSDNHLHVNNGIATAYPGEDAVSKSVAIYGQVDGSYEDLGVAHWEHTGFYGQYSLHGRTSLSSVTGSVYKIDFPDDQYEVEIGQKVKVEITVENFGKSSHDVRIGYYLSSNSNLTTQDRFLGSHVIYVTPNVPATIQSPALTIPSDLQDETEYWIGAIIDDNQQIAEVSEWNNRSSIRIYTAELPPNLVAFSIAGPASDKAGTSALVTSTIQSKGGDFDDGFTYEIRLSENTTISASDPLVASYATATFGSKVNLVTIPGGLPAGDYYWGLRVLSVTGEVKTSDNKVAGGKVTISAGNPNLAAMAVVGPVHGEVAEHVSLLVDVENLGGLYTGSYSFTVYISQDNDVEPSDWFVKEVTTSTLGTKVVNVIIPVLPSVGVYRWGVIVDPVPGETDLANNVRLGGSILITSIEGGNDDDLTNG